MADKVDITPALASQVDFSSQIDQVTNSLASRTAAKKKLTADWKAIYDGYTKYKGEMTAKRQAADYAYDKLSRIVIYAPLAEADADMKAIDKIDGNVPYYLQELYSRNGDALTLIEKALPGFKALVSSANAYRRRGNAEIDQEKTTAARAEVRALIDTYVVDLEALEDSEDVLSDVDRYISTVEKIANISAVANKGKQS